MFDSTLGPRIALTPTSRFSCYSFDSSDVPKKYVYVDLVCKYTGEIVAAAVARRDWCIPVTNIDNKKFDTILYQVCDFELIDWEPVLSGEHNASSFVVRKGMSRKAQFSLQMRKYVAKHPNSVLKDAIPYSLILDTWGAFENKVDLGMGLSASFDSCGAGSLQQSSLRQRLEWCLDDAKEEVSREGRGDWTWILKPSVTNKGADITVMKTWDELLDALEWSPDIREWVLQRYSITSALWVYSCFLFIASLALSPPVVIIQIHSPAPHHHWPQVPHPRLRSLCGSIASICV
jgi:hypothetical protein